MQFDIELFFMVLVLIMVLVIILGIIYENSKTKEKFDELEKKILKIETILEERKV